MGTCNFVTQSDFDLYIIDYDSPTQEEIDNYMIETGEMFNEELDEQVFYEDMCREAERLADKLNDELIFHEIAIADGYYTGLQTFINDKNYWKDYCSDIKNMDNEDCHYYFGMCRSKAIRKYKAEVKRINRKLLPKFKTELGFEQIKLVGVFSNGEAVYQRVN